MGLLYLFTLSVSKIRRFLYSLIENYDYMFRVQSVCINSSYFLVSNILNIQNVYNVDTFLFEFL